MMRKLALIAGVLLLASSGATSAYAQAERTITPPAGDWIHPSGMHFPATVGGFTRLTIEAFDQDTDDDVSVAYRNDASTALMLVSVFLYPTRPGKTCAQEFDGIMNSVVEATPQASRTSQRPAAAPSGRKPGSAFYARYTIPAGALREDIPALTSDVYLACSPDGKWNVHYRATWAGDSDQLGPVMGLMKGLPWGPLAE